MRPTLTGLAVLLGLGLFATAASAQDGGFSDPFYLYYSFYLPRQAALAAQPGPEDEIRYNNAQRQIEVRSERAGLYEPIPAIGLDELDPMRPFGMRSGSTRMVHTSPMGMVSTNLTGRGPSGYYNHVGSYYPTLRSGSGTGRGARRGGGGAASFGGGKPMRSISPPNALGTMGAMGGGFR